MARIVHVAETLATGVLSVLTTLARGQLRDGHEVFLIGSRDRPETPENVERLLPSRLVFLDLPMAREISPREDLRAAQALRKQLASLRPEVIHLHSSKAGALGRIAAFGLGVRVVYQPHGLAYLRRDVSALRRGLFAAAEFALSLLGGTVAACSEGERQALRFVTRTRQTALVLNGIDLSTMPLRSTASAAQMPRVGTCGRIGAQKRPEFFAAVARALRGRCEFVWIGDGEAQQRRLLEDAGAHVTGWCSHQQARQRIADLTVYVQTSAWEGLPVSVIEAMAAGLPIVATDIVGNRDLLLGTNAGHLVHNEEQMVRALEELLNDPVRYAQSSAEAQRIAHQRYSSEAMVAAYYDLYGIGSRQPAPLPTAPWAEPDSLTARE